MILAEWSELWDHVRGGWRAGDGYWSIAHPQTGDVIFACGDSVIHDGSLRAFPQSSCVLWRHGSDELELASYPDGWLLPTRVSTEFRWPGPMVWDCGQLWVFGHRLRRTYGDWGFEVLRKELHAFSWPAGGVPEAIGSLDYPAMTDVEWGAAGLALGEHLYVYGTRTPPGGYGADVFVMRVPTRGVTAFEQWEVWSDDGWGIQGAPSPVIPAARGPEMTFSVAYERESIHIVSKLHGGFGSQVTHWRSTLPQGPFLATPAGVDVPWRREDMTYGARAHHGLPRIDGHLVASVSHNFGGARLDQLFTPEGWTRYRASWHLIDM